MSTYRSYSLQAPIALDAQELVLFLAWNFIHVLEFRQIHLNSRLIQCDS